MRNDSIMKFKIEDDKLKMEISIEDLIFLVKEDPENYDGEDTILTVKEDKKQEFVNYIINHLEDINMDNENLLNWSVPFQGAFDELYVDRYQDFCEYKEDKEIEVEDYDEEDEDEDE